MGAFSSRQIAGVEEVDIGISQAYRYPPKQGKVPLLHIMSFQSWNSLPAILLIPVSQVQDSVSIFLICGLHDSFIAYYLTGGHYFGPHFIMGGERFDTALPEMYLFGENMDLNFLGSRPAPVSTSL